jgi:diguanylate cyclase (GGDEF)-like protein/PAS domain S-box-containing protein
MADRQRTKEELVTEIKELRRNVGSLAKRISELEAAGDLAGRLQVEAALLESEKRYRALFEGAGDAIFVLEAEGEDAGRILEANQAAARMHGYTMEELLSLQITDLDTLDYAKDVPRIFKKILGGEWVKSEIVHRKKDGTIFPVEIGAGLLSTAHHKYILAFYRDITERKRAEKVLRERDEEYRSLVESTEDSIYLIDRNYQYLFMNKKHLKRLGLTEDSFRGKRYGDIHSPEETGEFVSKVNSVFGTGKSVRHEHFSSRDRRYFLRTLSPVKDEDGTTVAVTVISKDISDLKEMQEKLRALSLTDELTGLYNRRGFFVLVEQMLKFARRQKKGLFMLYADLDNLKGINDSLGHKAGDLALIDAAAVLRETYRESDIIARIGGDEFVVIPIGGEKDNVDLVTARLEKGMEALNRKRSDYTLSISFGASYYNPESPRTIDELLAEAEQKMYDQKRLKRHS